MKRSRAFFIVIPFLITVFALFIINSIDIDEASSLAENRVLAQAPTYKNIFEGNFGTLYESYYTDQFVKRESFLKVYTQWEVARNKSTVRGLYITEGDYLLEAPTASVDEAYIQYNADIINRYGKVLSDRGKKVYYGMTPFKSTMLSFKYPKYVDITNLQTSKNRFIDKIEKEYVNVIDIGAYFKENFSDKELEQFYFRTDHHWNGEGAFEGAQYLIKNILEAQGIPYNKEMIQYESTVLENKKFQGSYSRQLYNVIDGQDEAIKYYYNPNKSYEYYIQENGAFKQVEDTELYARERWIDTMTYGGAYVWDDQYYKLINPKPLVDKKILIFRDSYHGATSWLFGDIFAEVEVVDPRYIEKSGNNCESIMGQTDADIILFMFHDQALNMVESLPKNSTVSLGSELTINETNPKSITVGEDFNLYEERPTMGVYGQGFQIGDIIYLNGRPQESAVGDSGWMTCFVEREVFQEIGNLEVVIKRFNEVGELVKKSNTVNIPIIEK